jgi:hypothetical protein
MSLKNNKLLIYLKINSHLRLKLKFLTDQNVIENKNYNVKTIQQ